MANQAPVALSILLCDSVQVDRATGKATILGLFEDVASTAFPTRHPDLTLFVELTDGRGQTPITLKICRTTAESLDGDVLSSTTLDVDFPDPRSIQKIILQVAPLDLPAPGEYRFILETGGAFIAERRLIARTV